MCTVSSILLANLHIKSFLGLVHKDITTHYITMGHLDKVYYRHSAFLLTYILGNDCGSLSLQKAGSPVETTLYSEGKRSNPLCSCFSEECTSFLCFTFRVVSLLCPQLLSLLMTSRRMMKLSCRARLPRRNHIFGVISESEKYFLFLLLHNRFPCTVRSWDQQIQQFSKAS